MCFKSYWYYTLQENISVNSCAVREDAVRPLGYVLLTILEQANVLTTKVPSVKGSSKIILLVKKGG